ncbi:MAG: hypothetical protein GVY16_09235 [Planctomycetes bacterium]|nr:hypothetical protein [Planctomycetota bacterium]
MTETHDTIVVAHQPNFLPWLGYFYKMAYSDIFVLLDKVQYTKGGYTNRVSINAQGQAMWLTVPVSLPQSKSPIDTVKINPKQFARKHLATLRQYYGKCRHFDEIYALLENHYAYEGDSLSKFNIGLLKSLAEYLSLPCRFVLQSDLGIEGVKNELLADLTKAAGGNIYAAGKGGQGYSEGETATYTQRGIRLAYQAFKHPEYSTDHAPFVAGCSIIDALFEHGIDTRTYLEPQASPPYDLLSP